MFAKSNSCKTRRLSRDCNPERVTESLDATTTEEQFRIVREQKLLLKSRNLEATKQLAAKYREAARRVTNDSAELERADNYASFVELYAATSSAFLTDAETLSSEFSRLSLLDLLSISGSVLTSIIESQSTALHRQLKDVKNSTVSTISERSDAYEFELQNYQGRAKDGLFAYARALNAASSCVTNDTRRSGNRKRLSRAKAVFEELLIVANRFNSLDYALDKVTYGEWYISSLDNSSRPCVVFAETDPLAARSRIIGLRRELVEETLITKRHRRYSRDILAQTCARATMHAEDYYHSHYSMPDLGTAARQCLQDRLSQELHFIDADDDLLIASDPNFFPHYLAGFLLRAYNFTATELTNELRQRKYNRYPLLPLPLDYMTGRMFENEELREHVRSALDAHIVTLPVRNYLDMLDRPFLRATDGCVYAIDKCDLTWLGALRQRLVVGGAQVEKFGKIWEDFVATAFEDHGWLIIGRAVKLYENGRTITDVDVIALENGLLLIVQVKAFAQSGFTVYSQWKSRNGIENGVGQASLASRYLQNNPNVVSRLMASKQSSLPLEKIQPLVVTNASIFGGWQRNGIPVIGLSDLMSILRGARVKFFNRQSVVEEVELCGESGPTSDDFLQLLTTPVSFHLSCETDATFTVSAGPGPVDLQIPIQVRRDGRSPN